MKKALITAVLGSISILACAQDKGQSAAATPETQAAITAAQAANAIKPAAGSAGERAVQAIQSLNPNIKVDDVTDAPLPISLEIGTCRFKKTLKIANRSRKRLRHSSDKR